MSTYKDFVTLLNSVPNLYAIPEVRKALGVPRKTTEIWDDTVKKALKQSKMSIALSNSLKKNTKTLLDQAKMMNKTVIALAKKEKKGAKKVEDASQKFVKAIEGTHETDKPGEAIKSCEKAWKDFLKVKKPSSIKSEVKKYESKITVLLKQLKALEVQLAVVLPKMRGHIVEKTRIELEYERSQKKLAESLKAVLKEKKELVPEAGQLLKGFKSINKTMRHTAI